MGIKDISVVTGGEHLSDISRYLSDMHPDLIFSFPIEGLARESAWAIPPGFL